MTQEGRGLKFYIARGVDPELRGSVSPRQFEHYFYRSACPLNISDINFLDFVVKGLILILY